MKFLLSLLIGAPIVYLATVVLTGGFEEAFGLIAMSIICTVGVGLVFWIPVCWLTGAIVLWIVQLIRSTSPASTSSAGHQAKPRADWSAMVNYLRKVQSKGGSLEAAKERLLGAGWNEIEIDNAMQGLVN